MFHSTSGVRKRGNDLLLRISVKAAENSTRADCHEKEGDEDPAILQTEPQAEEPREGGCNLRRL
jgi:hypothetical protein